MLIKIGHCWVITGGPGVGISCPGCQVSTTHMATTAWVIPVFGAEVDADLPG